MPWDETPNEIRHRLEDPDKYETCRRKNIDDGVDLIVCKKKDSDQWEAQALRFSKEKFDKESAKAWFEKHWKKEESYNPEDLKDLPEELPLVIEDKMIESVKIDEADIRDIGAVWEVTIIKAGQSKNGYYYTEQTLRDAMQKFEGAQVFAHHDGAHISQDKKSTRDLIGYIEQVQFIDGKLIGKLNILPSAEWFKRDLLFLKERNKLDLFQLSIDAGGQIAKENGKVIVSSIDVVYSVDVVPKAAAGGEFNKLIETITNKGETIMENTELKQEVEKALEEVKKTKCELMLKEKLLTSELPHLIQEDLKMRFSGKIFEEQELDLAIKNAKDLVAKLQENLKPEATPIKIKEEEIDKQEKGLLGFFLGRTLNLLSPDERKALVGNVPPYRSFREAYIDITGDTEITGLKSKAVKLREAITTEQFDQVTANVINKALIQEYRFSGWDTWREFVNIVPLSDFKTQYRIHIGGYGSLPTVAAGAPYLALTSPTDKQATYTPAKKGGTEIITLETIRNDDVGAISSIPRRLAVAAARTLHEFIYGILTPGANNLIYDGVYLYSASHPVPGGANVSNTGTTAIATGLNAARIAMYKFPEDNSYKRLGIRAKYVLVPPDLTHTAYELVTVAYGTYNETPTYLQTQGIKIIEVPSWTDTNDYAVVADPRDCVGFEIGFLDGKEEPEVFVSNLPDAGSFFNNDAITYKIRHIWGGAVINWRAYYGQVVT